MRESVSIISGFILTAAVGATSGVIGSVLYTRAQEVPPPLRVLDMRQLVQSIAADASLDQAQRRKRTEEVSRAVNEALEEQARRGAIVLDGSAVLRAPAPLYVAP